MDARTVYILTKEGFKVSHNTRVEWFIGNINKKVIFRSHGEPGLCGDENEPSPMEADAEINDFSDRDFECWENGQPVEWKMLSLVAALPSSGQLVYPLTYYLRPMTTVKFLADVYRITFVIDLSLSMLQPSSSGYCPLHHATTTIETMLKRLIPSNGCLDLPLKHFQLDHLSIFVSIIGVVPGQSLFTIVHDWEASMECLDSVILDVKQTLFHLEAIGSLTRPRETGSALIDMLRHGVLTLAMQKPDWAPASLIIISDGCFDTADMVELDRSLAHLRAEAIRCCFIILIPYDHAEVCDLKDKKCPRARAGLSMALSTGPCITHYDLCQFIAHATAGFCFANPSKTWLSLQLSIEGDSAWNEVHEMFLALKLQDDASSDAMKEGDLGWIPLEEIKPFSRTVHASITHVLASRLKDGYRLRSASVLALSGLDHRLRVLDTSGSEANIETFVNRHSQVPAKRLPHVQLELVLAWKPGVVFKYFLCGEWYLPIGHLPTLISNDYIVPQIYQKSNSLPPQHTQLQLGRHMSGLLPGNERGGSGNKRNIPYCFVNLKVFANYAFIRDVTRGWQKHVIHSVYRQSVIERFGFHLRLLNHVDDYLEKVSSFNLDPHIYRVSSQYLNGLSPVFLAVQAPGGNMKIQLAGNLTAEMANEKSSSNLILSKFASYWGNLLSLDIGNCYRWMHTDTIYILLEHDSPLPQNLFITLPGRRGTDTITCRQSLSRIHSMLCQWCSFVLLENHTYIRLEYNRHVEILNSSNPDVSKETSASNSLFDPSNSTVPCHFTLVRLEMKLPEVRVRIAFAAGIPSDLRRATLHHLSNQLRSLSFPPRGKQAVPKSRHKSGTFHHLSDVQTPVPPLQRSWAETPCCMVFRSRLDRLIVESGSWCGQRFCAIRSSNTERLPTHHSRPGLVKSIVSEVRCDVAPALLCQHLYHCGRVWVIPLHSKSASCFLKMFFTIMNLRIQEGFHFVRVGPQPGFVSLAREILFTSNSVTSEALPCLIQYQLYPFRQRNRKESTNSAAVGENTSNVNDSSVNIADLSPELLKMNADVQGVLDSRLLKLPRRLINRLKSMTSLRMGSDFQIATEIWIEPKHGQASCLPREADYLSSLSYKELVHRMLQLDASCLSAYYTLESLLTSCLLKIINLRKISCDPGGSHTPLNEYLSASISSEKRMPESPSNYGSANGLKFSLTNLTSVSPQLCLLYPLLLDASLMPHTQSAAKYVANENVIIRLCLNLVQRMPHVTQIMLSKLDSSSFCRFLANFQSLLPADRVRLGHLLTEGSNISWQCFASAFSVPEVNEFVHSKSTARATFADGFEKDSLEWNSSAVTFFLLPASFSVATSEFIQELVRCYKRRLPMTTSTPFEIERDYASFPIFIFSCSHTYLSYVLDDRWTYSRPVKVFVDFFQKSPAAVISEAKSSSLFFPHCDLPCQPPQDFLDSAKGNLRLIQELTSLWRCIKESTSSLSNLCDEAFVECTHRTLVHGFPVSDRALKTVLFTNRFCSSLPPIRIDATDFLLATCGHCFTVIKRNQSNQPSTACHGEVFARSELVLITADKEMACEIRLDDHLRLKNRLSTVLHEFFSPVPQYPGFYFFRLSSNNAACSQRSIHGDTLLKHIFCPDSQQAASSENLSTKDINELTTATQVVFSASPPSCGSGNEEETKSSFGHQQSSCAGPEEANPGLLHSTKPLFLKMHLCLTYNDNQVNLAGENFPICLIDLWPSIQSLAGGKQIIDIKLSDLRLEVVFTSRIWKPEFVSTIEDSNDILLTSSLISGDCDHTLDGHLQPVLENDQEENECLSFSESDSYSTGSETETSVNRRSGSRISRLRPQRHPPMEAELCSDDSENQQDDNCLPYYCDCLIGCLPDSETTCDLCNVLTCTDTQRYLSTEQRIAIQRTLLIFRWLLKDEVICSLRLLQPVSLRTLEIVLQHMENTNMLILNATPTHEFKPQYSCEVSTPGEASRQRASSREEAMKAGLQSLREITAGIRIDSANLVFVMSSDKAVPRFIERLEAISFRYVRGRLEKIDDFYFLCNAVCEDCDSHLFYSPLDRCCKQGLWQEQQKFQKIEQKSSEISLNKNLFKPLLRDLVRSCSDGNLGPDNVSLCRQEMRCQSSRSLCDPRRHSTENHSSILSTSRSHRKRLDYQALTSSLDFPAGYEGDASAAETEDIESFNSHLDVSALPPKACNLRLHPSSFPLQKIETHFTGSHPENCSFHGLPAYWLIFRVGSSSVSAYFHHSDTHRNDALLAGAYTFVCSDCPYCAVFEKAMLEINEAVIYVNRSLLLDQLSIDRICNPLLVPEDRNDQEVPPRGLLHAESSFTGQKTHRMKNKRLLPAHKRVRSSDRVCSTTSATDTDSTEASGFGMQASKCIQSKGVLRGRQRYQDAVGENNSITVDSYSRHIRTIRFKPGMFACDSQWVERIEIHPRAAASGGERGRKVLPELCRLLENIAVLNRSNMFVLIDSQEARIIPHTDSGDSGSISSAIDFQHARLLKSTCVSAVPRHIGDSKRRASAVGISAQNKIFYMLLSEVSESSLLDRNLAYTNVPVGVAARTVFDKGISGNKMMCNIRRESLPAYSAKEEVPCIHTNPIPFHTSQRLFLEVSLHAIAAPNRHLKASVRQHLQFQLDKIVLQRLSEALSRNALSRLTLYDFDFFFSRKWDHPLCRLTLHLPELFTSSQRLCGVPNGSLVLAFSQYLKQNLLLYMHLAKPERELITFVRNRLGCGELFLYNRARGLGVSKSGIATVQVKIMRDVSYEQKHAYFKPYTISSFIGPHEWFHLRSTQTSTPFSLEKLCVFLNDTRASELEKMTDSKIVNGVAKEGNDGRLVVKFRIWERGDADLQHLVERLKATVKCAIFDLITEYLLLTQHASAIEIPVFKYRSTGSVPTPPITLVDCAEAKGRFLPGCVDSSFVSNFQLLETSVQMSPYILDVLLPWFQIARNMETPLVTARSFQLTSDLSLEFLVGELITQLNKLVEDSNSTHVSKCPILHTMHTLSGKLVGPFDLLLPSRGGARALNGSLQPSCACLKMINFFGFQLVNPQESTSGCAEWATFAHSTSGRSTEKAPGQRKEFMLIGRNYSICRYEATLDRINHDVRRAQEEVSRTPLKVTGSTQQTASHDPIFLAKPFATWLGRVALQRQQPLEIQIQLVSEEVELNAPGPHRARSTDVAKTAPGTCEVSPVVTHHNSDAAMPAAVLVPSSTASSGTAFCDLPEFCSIHLRLSEYLLQPLYLIPSMVGGNSALPSRLPQTMVNTSDLSTAKESVHEAAETGSSKHFIAPLNIPRQALCLIHIEGRSLTVYTYNWVRDEVDRLGSRVETLVSWYNQRFQLLRCLSMQKLGLFHNLQNSLHSSLLLQLSELGSHTCPPELVSGHSMGNNDVPSSLVLTGGQFSGAAPPPLPPPNLSRELPKRSVGHLKPVFSFLNDPTQLLDAKNNCEVTPAALNRIFQDCARVPRLLPMNVSHPNPIDIVNNYTTQALEAASLDRRRAYELRLITSPLELWFKCGSSGAGATSSGSSVAGGEANNLADKFSPDPIDSAHSSLSCDPRDSKLKDSFENLAVYYSAVKRISRTLHTVCAPILFSPLARSEAIRLQQVERTAEEFYSSLQTLSDCGIEVLSIPPKADNGALENSRLFESSSVSAVAATSAAGSELSGSLSQRKQKRHPKLSSLVFKTEPVGSSHSQSRSIPDIVRTASNPILVSVPHTAAVAATAAPGITTSSVRSQHRLNTGFPDSAPYTLPLPASPTMTNPPWVREASRTLLDEYVHYLTSQVHFSVIHMSPTNSKRAQPYALLQRSIQMTGIHLIEVFIRENLFCVRLRAVELCRFSRRASRNLMTGPVFNCLLGQAAAAAAASLTSAIIAAAAVDGLVAGGDSLPRQRLRHTRQNSRAPHTPVSPVSVWTNANGGASGFNGPRGGGYGPSTSSGSSPSVKFFTETTKWEESSRLCDCTHLHSFLYDFYLRHVDRYLRRQPNLLMLRPGSSTHLRSFPETFGTTTSISSFCDRCFIPPPGFPVIDFLNDLEFISPSPPVFARGAFNRIRISLNVGNRINPEQVFDHLVEERATYGIQAFELGFQLAKSPGVAISQRYGLCEFSEISKASVSSSSGAKNHHLHSSKPPLVGGVHAGPLPGAHHYHRHLNVNMSQVCDVGKRTKGYRAPSDKTLVLSDSSQSDVANDDSSDSKSGSSDDTDNSDVVGVEPNAFGDPVVAENPGKLVMLGEVKAVCGESCGRKAGQSRRCLPKVKLPATPFSVACGICLDRQPSTSSLKSHMTLSIFIVLTDQQRKFPRSRLTSLPDGLPSKHISPVEWPAIRPSFSFNSDLTKPPAGTLQRSGSQETAPPESETHLNLMKPQRTRHTSLMLRYNDLNQSQQHHHDNGNPFFHRLPPTQESENYQPPPHCHQAHHNRGHVQHPNAGDPGLRWKISYLGVWPSHQIKLSRAFAKISHSWRRRLREIVDLAILNCHKNLLWYRLFDHRQFPTKCRQSLQIDSGTDSELEQGEDLLVVTELNLDRALLPSCFHRGLSLEEFQDLLGCAPVHIDLLRMDYRLTELLNLGGMHLLSIVEDINAAWATSEFDQTQITPSGRAVAFLYSVPIDSADNVIGEEHWQMHMGLICPGFSEGLVCLRWTETRKSIPHKVYRSRSRPSSGLSWTLIRNYLSLPIEGVSLGSETSSIRTCSNFIMKAVFRSPNNLDVRGSSVSSLMSNTSSSGLTPSAQRAQEIAYQKSPLLPPVKNLVERLSFFVWQDLHSAFHC